MSVQSQLDAQKVWKSPVCDPQTVIVLEERSELLYILIFCMFS